MKIFRTWPSSQSRPVRFVTGAVMMTLFTIVGELILSDDPLSRHMAAIIATSGLSRSPSAATTANCAIIPDAWCSSTGPGTWPL
jgi:hypothetical protein